MALGFMGGGTSKYGGREGSYNSRIVNTIRYSQIAIRNSQIAIRKSQIAIRNYVSLFVIRKSQFTNRKCDSLFANRNSQIANAIRYSQIANRDSLLANHKFQFHVYEWGVCLGRSETGNETSCVAMYG